MTVIALVSTNNLDAENRAPVFPYAAAAITASDTDTYNPPLLAVYVGVTGDVTVKLGTAATTAVTFKAVPAGMCPPVSGIVQVMSTATTATNLIGIA